MPGVLGAWEMLVGASRARNERRKEKASEQKLRFDQEMAIRKLSLDQTEAEQRVAMHGAALKQKAEEAELQRQARMEQTEARNQAQMEVAALRDKLKRDTTMTPQQKMDLEVRIAEMNNRARMYGVDAAAAAKGLDKGPEGAFVRGEDWRTGTALDQAKAAATAAKPGMEMSKFLTEAAAKGFVPDQMRAASGAGLEMSDAERQRQAIEQQLQAARVVQAQQGAAYTGALTQQMKQGKRPTRREILDEALRDPDYLQAKAVVDRLDKSLDEMTAGYGLTDAMLAARPDVAELVQERSLRQQDLARVQDTVLRKYSALADKLAPLMPQAMETEDPIAKMDAILNDRTAITRLFGEAERPEVPAGMIGNAWSEIQSRIRKRMSETGASAIRAFASVMSEVDSVYDKGILEAIARAAKMSGAWVPKSTRDER